jgi:hypothetical protein
MQLDTVVYINPNAYDDKLVSSDRYDIDIVSSDWHVPITNSESDNPMLNAYTNQPNVECVLTEIKPMSNAYRNLKMSNACMLNILEYFVEIHIFGLVPRVVR